MGQPTDPLHNQEGEPVHLQAELPTVGTVLNPHDEGWAFEPIVSASPTDNVGNTIQEGK